MDHQRAVDAVEGAGLHHPDLATAALLGRRSKDADLHADLVGDAGQRDARAHGGGGDDVVPAGVAYLRQRVVLRQKRDVERTRAERSTHGGRQAAGLALDLEAGLVEPVGDDPAGQRLLVAQLGVIVNPVGELDQRGVGSLRAITRDRLVVLHRAEW